LNESHKFSVLEEAHGDSDHNALLEALNELNMSIDSFSGNYQNIVGNPQRFVDYVLLWITSIINSMNMVRDYVSENSTTKDDAELFEKVKQSYQKSMTASENLYNLLNTNNNSPRRTVTLNLSNWPKKQ
jgi:hypothetical protein